MGFAKTSFDPRIKLIHQLTLATPKIAQTP
jgi:hypothetical protein